MVVLEDAGKRFDRTVDPTGDPTGTGLEPGTLTLVLFPGTYASLKEKPYTTK